MRRLLMGAVLLLPATTTVLAQDREWQPLFDGKSLGGWRETPFSGKGPARIENGVLVLGPGAPLTGVTWTTPSPKRLRGSLRGCPAARAATSSPA